MATHRIFILGTALLLGCSDPAPDDAWQSTQAVSGPGWCKQMTQAKELELKGRKDLAAYRYLRDYYADCYVDPADKKADLLAAAREAAQLGDQGDRQEYASWQMTFGSADSRHAP